MTASPKQFYHGTPAQWTAADAAGFRLLMGQIGFIINADGVTVTLIFGNGISPSTSLRQVKVTDTAVIAAVRDRATHTGTQAVGSILSTATDVFFGRDSSGAGVGEEISASAARTILGVVTDNSGSGSPEGVVTAGVGTIYRRTGGTAGTVLYVKESGSGNTGWVAYAAGKVNFRPESYGAVGDGSTDDTVAVRAAFTAANALLRTGIIGTFRHPGATVVLQGNYNLSSIATPIDIECNVEGDGAALIVPTAYAGIVLRVGATTSGRYYQAFDLKLPDVSCPAGSTIGTAGSVGVKLINVANSAISFGRVHYMETGIWFSGLGQGTVYNTVDLGHPAFNKVAVQLKPETGGWVNQNTFIGGGIQQTSGYGFRTAGWCHILLDGASINFVNGNRFFNTSLEGDTSQYHIQFKQAADNTFFSPRLELGSASKAVTFSGGGSATITRTAHGLAVDDVVIFVAASYPTGLFPAVPYYVIATPNADTFTVAQKKGGTAATFSTAGTTVLYYQPPRVFYDTDGNTKQNKIVDPYFWLNFIEQIGTTIAQDNTVQYPHLNTIDHASYDDTPLYRTRQRTAGTKRPHYAAYGTGVDHARNPHGWSTALSDRGLVFAASEAETGLLDATSGGVPQWTPLGATARVIGNCLKGSAVLDYGSIAAHTALELTISVTGAVTGDDVTVHTTNMDTGLIPYASVTASDTVTVRVVNYTASAIDPGARTYRVRVWK